MSEPLSQILEDEAIAAAIALAIEREPRALIDTGPPSPSLSPWGFAGRLVQLNRAPRRAWR